MQALGWLMAASLRVPKPLYGVAFSSSSQFVTFTQYFSGSQGSHFLSGHKLLTSRVVISGPNTEISEDRERREFGLGLLLLDVVAASIRCHHCQHRTT